MKLRRIKIQSFRSIYNQTIEINHNCIGLVGINEAGKTNVLDVIRLLNSEHKLSAKDISKDATNNLSIEYYFDLTEIETTHILNVLNTFIDENTKDVILKSNLKLSVLVKVEFKNFKKHRSVVVNGIEFKGEVLFLKSNFVAKGYQFKIEKEFVPIGNIWAASPKLIKAEKKNQELNIQKREILVSINQLEKNKEQINDDDEKKELNKIDQEIEKEKEKLSKIESKITFDIIEFENEEKVKLSILEDQLLRTEEAIVKEQSEKDVLDKLPNKNSSQTNKAKALEGSIGEHFSSVEKIKTQIEKSNQIFEGINQDISDNFSNDVEIFEEDFGGEIEKYLESIIPNVTFWTSKKEYMLPSEISINELIEEASEVPRPLLNIFRIGLNVKNEIELKALLKNLSNSGSKRSASNAEINTKVNEFIKGVWEDYDQELLITIEKDLIRLEIYDPKQGYKAKYYDFLERSQGCKTFLSFILTIGAESKSNIFKDKILLLDEPETHLHPSGQRFLLKELRKIAMTNIVVYATHSNHLIIRDNYDQHLIVSKTKEETTVEVSQKNRIGYFMQEEVLYNALGVSLSSDLSTIEDYNFVFEGLGDVILFKHYYDSIATTQEKPFKSDKIKFYQGGKCTDIMHSFKHRPIQLGTKWVFILDSDKPADNLKKFITGRYKDYNNKDIFVYQYPTTFGEGELEDLIEENIILEAYEKSMSIVDIVFDKVKIQKIIKKEKSYSKYSKQIITQIVKEKEKEFIPEFKSIFNEILLNLCKELNTKNKFEETLVKYTDFAKKVLEDIKRKNNVI